LRNSGHVAPHEFLVENKVAARWPTSAFADWPSLTVGLLTRGGTRHTRLQKQQRAEALCFDASYAGVRAFLSLSGPGHKEPG